MGYFVDIDVYNIVHNITEYDSICGIVDIDLDDIVDNIDRFTVVCVIFFSHILTLLST